MTTTTLADRLRGKVAAATDGVDRARAAIEAHAQTRDPAGLLDLVYAFAVHVERCRTFTWASMIADVNPDELPAWLLEQALASPDDDWSGRANDLKRVQHDARREALHDIDQLTRIL